MSLRIAFQMDPINKVDVNADTTFRLIEEAQRRGHSSYVYEPESLRSDRGKIIATASSVRVDRNIKEFAKLHNTSDISLKNFDIVWLRQDPPFDMLYITTTHLLDLISSDVHVVNNPFWVRNFPEKLLVLQFPKLIPPTLVSRDLVAIKRFHKDLGEIIIKFKNVLVPEINMGQLIKLIRSEYLVDAKGLNQVTGRPISASKIIETVKKIIG